MNKYKKGIILTIFTAFSLIGLNELQSKSPITNHQGNSNSVLAQSSAEITRNRVFKKADCATVTIQAGGGHGSGFLVNDDGLIITNAHVLAGGPNVVTVKLHDGRKVGGNVVGFSYNGIDLAAVKIPKKPNVCKLTLANPNSIQVGYDAFALGTPLDSEDQPRTFTQGIISKLNARDGMIQHTAYINKGNSGGPLLNSNGDLIGVNTQGLRQPVFRGNTRTNQSTGTNIGFAIPVTQVQTWLNDIETDNTSKVSTLPTGEILAQPLLLNGRTIEGNLTKDESLKYYVFEGKAGQTITIEMDSNDFDPLFALCNPSDNIDVCAENVLVQSNDKGAGDVNQILKVILPEDGQYGIIATSKTYIEGEDALLLGRGFYVLSGYSD